MLIASISIPSHIFETTGNQFMVDGSLLLICINTIYRDKPKPAESVEINHNTDNYTHLYMALMS